jgi:hypothetical protein
MQMQAHHINPLTGEDEGLPDGALADRGTAAHDAAEATWPVDPNDPNTWGKVQRNAPCPCGSGRKFKHCHGALVSREVRKKVLCVLRASSASSALNVPPPRVTLDEKSVLAAKSMGESL